MTLYLIIALIIWFGSIAFSVAADEEDFIGLSFLLSLIWPLTIFFFLAYLVGSLIKKVIK